MEVGINVPSSHSNFIIPEQQELMIYPALINTCMSLHKSCVG